MGTEKDDALGKRGSYHPFRNPSLLNLRPGSLDPVTPLALCQWSLASSLEKGASPCLLRSMPAMLCALLCHFPKWHVCAGMLE